MEIQDIISSGLLELYAVGAATPEETTQVEGWLAQYPEVADALSLIEMAMESYAMANAIAPSASFKNKLMASLSVSKAAPSKVVSLKPWRMAAAAAAVLLIGSSVLNVVYYNKYKDADNKFQQEQRTLAEVNTKMDDMNARIGDMSNDMNIVRSKYSEPVSLHGLDAAPSAGAKIFWMKNTGEVYVDPGNMPMAPDGMEYQLWGMVDGKAVDGGMITSKDGKNYSIQKMKSFGKAQAFAITLETKGGNPQPKGKMYVMGNI